jgi:hypothetical protein
LRKLVARIALAVVLLWSLVSAPLGAQDTTVTVVGVVVDSATRLPLPDVLIHIDGSYLADSSDRAGEFALPNVSYGSHTVLLMRDGYLPGAFRLVVPEALAGEIDAGVLELSQGLPPTAVLSGTIVDAQTRQPIAGVNVVLNGTRLGSSNVAGMFLSSESQVMWGLNQLDFQRIGYSPLQTELWVEQEQSDLSLDITLAPAAIPLDEVVVEGARDVQTTAGLAPAFIRRRRLGGGDFFVETDIEAIKPRYATDIFRRTPGLVVRPDGTGGFVVRNARNRFCGRPILFVDGVRIPNADDLNWIVPTDFISAVEVYASAAQVPPELSMIGSNCGVIVVWTR